MSSECDRAAVVKLLTRVLNFIRQSHERHVTFTDDSHLELLLDSLDALYADGSALLLFFLSN